MYRNLYFGLRFYVSNIVTLLRHRFRRLKLRAVSVWVLAVEAERAATTEENKEGEKRHVGEQDQHEKHTQQSLEPRAAA